MGTAKGAYTPEQIAIIQKMAGTYTPKLRAALRKTAYTPEQRAALQKALRSPSPSAEKPKPAPESKTNAKAKKKHKAYWDDAVVGALSKHFPDNSATNFAPKDVEKKYSTFSLPRSRHPAASRQRGA